jgi:hypothetical protein
VFLLLPSEGGLLDGIPAGRLDTIGLVLVAWIAAHRVRPAGGVFAAAVAIAAAAMTAAIPGERGLNARYFATAAATGAHERSTEHRDRAVTRVDASLDFTRGDRDFPLAFFNDHTRFNYLRPGEPNRRDLEFAAAWTGWWLVDEDRQTIYLHAPKSGAQISIDTLPVLTGTPQSDDQIRELTLAKGWHRLHITFSSPYAAPREFSAGVMVDGRREPFGARQVRTDRIDARQQWVAALLAIGKPVADVMLLAWLAGMAGLLLIRRVGEVWQLRARASQAALFLFAVAGAVEAMRFAWPWATRLLIMIAGDDPMTYEAYARDIQLNGILMNGGAPPGQGEPFYYQAFYPYFLAASHLIFGESMFGVLFLQRLLVATTAIVLTRMAMKLRGDTVWPVALLVSGLFAWWKFAPIAADLLNESLYIPLLCAWASSLVTFGIGPSQQRAAIGGVLGGLAAITRSTAMLSWVLVWPACWWSSRKKSGSRTVLTLAACSLAVFSLIAIRNAIVSHQFAPTSTELGVTLLGGNPPPAGLALNPAARKGLYDWLGVGGQTAEVIEYALTAPGSFAANMGRKALFALGFYEPYAEGWGYSPVYIAVWLSGVFGLVILLREGGTDRIAVTIPLLIAITQFAAVVIVYPKGERLILPIHTLLVPYAAIAAHHFARRFAS